MARYGVLNAHMFGRPTEPGEHVNWSEPDVIDEIDFTWLESVDAETYAEENPHMIVFVIEAS